MVTKFDIQSGLNKPHSGDNPALDKLIRGSIKRKARTSPAPSSCLTHPWNESLFFLNKSQLYKALNDEDKIAILTACNNFILSESYFIEKAGLGYCAKMILLGDSTEIRQMYGLIASDESVHLQWLSPFVPQNLRTAPQGKFIYAVSSMIEQCDLNTLFYLVQTILEGWGVSYYKTLAATCQREDLKAVLSNIVKDEAIHHQTGLALFSLDNTSPTTQKQLIEGMQTYCEILKVGAQNIVQCVENVVGELSTGELIKLFRDLQTELSGKFKLGVLKSIMTQPAMLPFIQQLEDKGYFKPYSAEKCADIYIEQRN